MSQTFQSTSREFYLIENTEIHSVDFCDGDHRGHLLQVPGEPLSPRTEDHLESRVMKSFVPILVLFTL